MKAMRGGFTLVELLVVITIIALLIALLLPAVQAARETGRRAACMNNVKQLCLAMQNYESGFQMLPINFGAGTNGTVNRGHSWVVGILPYVEQQGLFDRIKMEQPLGDSSNTWVSQQPLPLLICPADTENRTGIVRNAADIGGPRGSSNYKACAGSNWNWGGFQGVSCPQGRWAGNPDGLDRGNGILCRNEDANVANCTTVEDIKDGASNTFAVGEAVPVWSRWASWYYWNHATATCAIPLNYQKGTVNLADAVHAADWSNNYCFFSKHVGGGHFGMIDGSVRFLNDSIDTATYRALATISGGELVQLP